MNVGIIGCGYLGKAVASHLRNKGFIVSVTTRQASRIEELKQVANQVFLLETNQLQHFLALQDIILISVAPNSQTDSYEETYLNTVKTLIQNLDHCPNLKQIIYTGSTSVYGDRSGEWVDEETPVSPQNEQARILCQVEDLLLNQASNQLKVCIFRLGEIYGPHREIKERLKRLQGKAFAGSGDQQTNLIHLDDIVSAVNFALQHHLNGLYNLCSDYHVSRKVFYEEICRKEGLSAIEWNPQLKNIHGGNRKVSNHKLKQMGFKFKHPDFII